MTSCWRARRSRRCGSASKTRGREMTLSADDLLLGGAATTTITVPAAVLHPTEQGSDGTVVLRPLRLVELQRIHKAAQDQEALTSVLMVQQALVEPKLTVDQVSR